MAEITASNNMKAMCVAQETVRRVAAGELVEKSAAAAAAPTVPVSRAADLAARLAGTSLVPSDRVGEVTEKIASAGGAAYMADLMDAFVDRYERDGGAVDGPVPTASKEASAGPRTADLAADLAARKAEMKALSISRVGL